MLTRRRFLSITTIAGASLTVSAFADDPPIVTSALPVELKDFIPEFETLYKSTVLDAWFPLCLDLKVGGYKCNFDYKWADKGKHEKLIIFQSRQVFVSSAGAIEYPDVPIYTTAAQHGYNFLNKVMWDAKYGGFYEGRSPSGGKHDKYGDEKRAYGNSFGIIGLVQYYKLTEDPNALALAIKCFEWMEQYVHDSADGGYYFGLSRDNKVLTQKSSSKASDKYRFGYKDQNTHLHVLEAFSDLYEVWPDERVKARTLEIINLVMNTMTDPRGYVAYYFTRDWKSFSSKDAQLDHNHMMFSHNIEFVYFMLRALDRVGIPETPAVTQYCQGIMDTVLKFGWDPVYDGLFTEGRWADTTCVIDDPTKERYAEDESLLTFLWLADRYPDRAAEYVSCFLKQWAYVKRYSIDYTYPGWYKDAIDRTPSDVHSDKGGGTKAGYHDTRGLLLTLKILKRI